MDGDIFSVLGEGGRVISTLWAKTSQLMGPVIRLWHPLILHLLDVAACAAAILNREPESTRKRIVEILCMTWDESRAWILLIMGVRHDRSGVLDCDYQTAGCADSDSVIRANGTLSEDGIVSQRHYLADAAFLVALEGDDRDLLEKAHAKLKDPTWPLALGRNSYLQAEPVWIKDGVKESSLLDTLKSYPWLGSLRRWEEEPPEQLLVSMESEDGSGVLKMDQPLSSFAERHFGARFVRSEWIPFPREVADVPE